MEKKHSDIGTKLMNELMVDIIGAVIPGLLFIVVVINSIALPCCIYGTDNNGQTCRIAKR